MNTNRKSKLQGVYKTVSLVNRNKMAEVYYRKAIMAETEKLIQALYKDVKKNYMVVAVQNAEGKPSANKLRSLFKKYKGEYLDTFLRNSEKIITKWWKKLSQNTKRQFKEVYKKEVGVDMSIRYSNIYDKDFKMFLDGNVGLIQNTTLQTLNNVENIVYNNVTTGQGISRVESDLSRQTDIAKDRLKRIARDQTAKANEAINRVEQQSAGVEFFEWSTVEDEAVSTGYGGHKQLNGKIYKWGDVEHYPIIDSYGHRGLPGERVNCRCSAKAVILLKDYNAKMLSDGSYEITQAK